MVTHNRKHYLMVGIFTITCIILTIFIGVWLSFGLKKKEVNHFEAIFHGSVDGLYLNAPIKFNGVNIGTVKDISLDKSKPGDIIINMDIFKGTPITTDTYATLKSQGITGLSYVSLQIDSPHIIQKIISPSLHPPYTKIPTRPSLFSNVTKQLTHISENIGKLTDHITEIFNDKNIKMINEMLENIKNVSNNLIKITNTANVIAVQTNKITNGINETTLPMINNILIPNLLKSISNFNSTSNELTSLLTELNKNPSILIRGSAPLQPGPGE